MIFDAVVGRQEYVSGAQNPYRLNPYGELMTEQVGKYAEATKQGRVFSITSQAAVAVTDTLATTWTGLGVGNPAQNTKDLVMLSFSAVHSVVLQKAGTIGIEISKTSMTASLTPVNRRPGGVASTAYASAGQTIITPVLWDVCGSFGTANTNSEAITSKQIYNIDGSIILTPGYMITAFTTLDSTAAFLFSFLWEEKDN